MLYTHVLNFCAYLLSLGGGTGGGGGVYISPCSLAVDGIGLHLGMTMRMGGIHIFDLDFYFTVHQPCKFE